MDTKRVGEFINLIESDNSLSDEDKKQLMSSLVDLNKPLDTDRWIYRFVVCFLGLAVLITIIGGIYLTKIGGTSPNFQLPQGIVAIGSAAIGALAGLLAPSPNRN